MLSVYCKTYGFANCIYAWRSEIWCENLEEDMSKLCDAIAHKCIAQNYKQQSKALRLLRFEDSSVESCLCSVK